MSAIRCPAFAAVMLLLGAGTSGCQSSYRSQTILHADGSVERAIYQKVGSTPEEIRRSGVWRQSTYAPDPDHLERQGWSGDILDLFKRPTDEKHAYFAASATFKSPKDIPEHVLFKTAKELGLPDGKLKPDYIRNDYVLVTEHLWRETLNDVVKLDEMRKAREELAELLIQVGEDIFVESLGPDYDASELAKWLRTEGKTWLAEITEFAFVHCTGRKGPAARLVLWDEMAAICARHGLVLKDQGKFLENEKLGQAFRNYVTRQACQHVRRKKDGKPVDPETVAAWLKELENSEKDPASPNRFAAAANIVIAQKHGGQQAFERRFDALLGRVAGLYRMGFFVPIQFDYTMTMPGEIVETNGQVLADSRLRWQFDVADAYPAGYEMACRSLQVQSQVQQDLLQRQPLQNREALLRFVSLVAGKEPLLNALKECRKQKSTAPLYAYRKTLKEETKEVDQVLRPLQLPQ